MLPAFTGGWIQKIPAGETGVCFMVRAWWTLTIKQIGEGQ